MVFLNTPVQPPQQPIITVWVHGTRPKYIAPTIFKPLIDPIDKILFLEKKGLFKASQLNDAYYLKLLCKKLCNGSGLFDFDNMYIFSWSGKLSVKERKLASAEFFKELSILSSYYQKFFSMKPIFIIVTHSHGGNVALHLAEYATDNQTEIQIAKLILLACPVQRHTKEIIDSKIFEKIYNIHSHTDTIQIMDPQGVHALFEKNIEPYFKKFFSELFPPFLSERHFKPNKKIIPVSVRWKKGIKQSDNDSEIIGIVYLQKIKLFLKALDLIKSNRGLTHVEFNLIPFITKLPQIIRYVDSKTETEIASLTKKNIKDIVIEL